VLLAPRLIVNRVRRKQQRAEDLARLRSMFRQLPGPEQAEAELVALAQRLASLRERMIEALGTVASCGRCATGHPLPFGRWDGGHCCGGRTEQLFTEDEVAAMKLVGVSMRALPTPDSDQAGCAFRGPTGCSLGASQRPNLCVRYLCRDLEREVRLRGDKPELDAIANELALTFERFVARRRELAEESAWAELARAAL
jgi:hypothetical protein